MPKKIIDLDQVRDYFYCPLLFYWKHVSEMEHDGAWLSTLRLPRKAIQQALATYATGQYSQYNLPSLVNFVWKQWLEQKNVGNDVAPALLSFHEGRMQILTQFISGKIRKKGGNKYIEPRAATRYKNMMRTAQLNKLSDDINESCLEKLGIFEGTMNFLSLGSYSLANAFSDSLYMAEKFPLPAVETIHGVSIACVIDLGNGELIETTADMVLAGHNTSTIFVHDCAPYFAVKRTWIPRRLDMIAASQSQAKKEQLSFPPVDTVVYRHFMTGAEIVRKNLRNSRLTNAMHMALRGISIGHYPPAFFSGDLSRCNGCEAESVCLEGGDTLEHILPGAEHIASNLQKAQKLIAQSDKTVLDLVANVVELDLAPSDVVSLIHANKE